MAAPTRTEPAVAGVPSSTAPSDSEPTAPTGPLPSESVATISGNTQTGAGTRARDVGVLVRAGKQLAPELFQLPAAHRVWGRFATSMDV